MTEPTNPPDPAPAEVMSRVEARLQGLDPSASSPAPQGPSTSWADSGAGTGTWDRGGRAGHWAARSASPVEDLDRQLAVLRSQLDDAFDDLEDRLADAEARAEEAHRRIDQLVALLDDASRPSAPNGPGQPVPAHDLARALQRLRARLRPE